MSRTSLDRWLSGPVLLGAGLLCLGIAALGQALPQTQPFVAVSMLATSGLLGLAIGVLCITRPQTLRDMALRARHSQGVGLMPESVFESPWYLRYVRIWGVLAVLMGAISCWGAVAKLLAWIARRSV